MERILEGTDDLRERMTLFWHGYFTSAYRNVKSSYELIQQNQLLRKHAVGNYGDLLRKILRDPAMLLYLDNAKSDERACWPRNRTARSRRGSDSIGEISSAQGAFS